MTSEAPPAPVAPSWPCPAPVPRPRRSRLVRPWTVALASTALFFPFLALSIAGRFGLSVDELHSAMLGRLWADGERLSFYVGSLTRYEGGSWLIAWPVSWLMRAGAWPTFATCWTAGGISLVAVFLASLWLAREQGPRAGFVLGPLLALTSPELLHYSSRAWGSLCEALVFLPALALLLGTWIDSGRRLATAPLLGLGLAGAIVFSYLHLLTALAMPAVLLLEGGRRRWRRTALEVSVIGGTALAALAAWVEVAVPIRSEAFEIRGGRHLLATLRDLLLPRLDLVALHLPAAWVGEFVERSPARLAAGCLLTLLSIGAGIAAWRRGGRIRWVVVYVLLCLPAVAAGHRMAPPPQVLRYYLPLLAACAVLLASWDRRAIGLAALAGMVLRPPLYLPEPWQATDRSYMELGASALHRYASNPHTKFGAFYRITAPPLRPYLAFGYGLDQGTRFSRSWGGMRALASPGQAVDPAGDPHLYLWQARSWIDFWPHLPDRAWEPRFFQGLGVGLLRDGRVDDNEIVLLGEASPVQRGWTLEGVGAALSIAAEQGRGLAGWDDRFAEVAGEGDVAALRRGMDAVTPATSPPGGAGGVPAWASAVLADLASSPQATTLPRDVGLRWMVLQPVVPTPER